MSPILQSIEPQLYSNCCISPAFTSSHSRLGMRLYWWICHEGIGLNRIGLTMYTALLSKKETLAAVQRFQLSNSTDVYRCPDDNAGETHYNAKQYQDNILFKKKSQAKNWLPFLQKSDSSNMEFLNKYLSYPRY